MSFAVSLTANTRTKVQIYFQKLFLSRCWLMLTGYLFGSHNFQRACILFWSHLDMTCFCLTTPLSFMMWSTFSWISCLADGHTVSCHLFYEMILAKLSKTFIFPLSFFFFFSKNYSDVMFLMLQFHKDYHSCLWMLVLCIYLSILANSSSVRDVTHFSKTFLSIGPESPKVIWWSWHHLQLLLYLIYKSSVTNLIPGFNFQFN